jgi:hypothetical protein
MEANSADRAAESSKFIEINSADTVESDWTGITGRGRNGETSRAEHQLTIGIHLCPRLPTRDFARY